MRAYTFNTAADALRALTQIVIMDGDKVEPRGQKTREMRDVVIQIDDPTDPCMFSMNRDWNASIAVAEFLQLVGGFSDPARMKAIAPSFGNFMNGGAFHGAYGPRTAMQFDRAIDMLRRDPSTRQAVVQIWDPLHDQLPGRKDIPCTLGFVFSIRKDELHMATHMRSNDLWWGWSYDAFQFTQLQCTVANLLNLAVGPYVHYVNSLHVYERDFDKALSLTERDGAAQLNARLTGIGQIAQDWAEIQSDASSFFYGKPWPTLLNTSEAFMVHKMRKHYDKA